MYGIKKAYLHAVEKKKCYEKHISQVKLLKNYVQY